MHKNLVEDRQIQVQINADPDTITLLWDQLAYEDELRGCVQQSTTTEPDRMGATKNLIVALGYSAKRIVQAATALDGVLKACLKRKHFVITVTKTKEDRSVSIDGYGELEKLLPTIENFIKNIEN